MTELRLRQAAQEVARFPLTHRPTCAIVKRGEDWCSCGAEASSLALNAALAEPEPGLTFYRDGQEPGDPRREPVHIGFRRETLDGSITTGWAADVHPQFVGRFLDGQ